MHKLGTLPVSMVIVLTMSPVTVALAPGPQQETPTSRPATVARAQEQQVPAVGESWNVHTYPGRTASLAQLVFAELAVWADNTSYQLHKGVYHHDYRPQAFGREDVTLEDAALLPSSEAGQQYAVVVFEVVTCGGSCSPTGFVHVLHLHAGRLVVRQQLRFVQEGDGTGAWYDKGNGMLRVVARTNDDTGHCCPTHVDDATYKWTGSAFKLTGWRTRPIQKKH